MPRLLSNGKRWVHDERNKLFLHFIELALSIQPKCILMENVPLVLFSFAKAFEREVVKSFEGYDVKVKVLNASAFGVPQIRKRVFVVAFRQDLKITDKFFPEGTFTEIESISDARKKSRECRNFINVESAIGDLPPLSRAPKLMASRILSRL